MWEIDVAYWTNKEKVDKLLAEGWEPYAVTREVEDGEQRDCHWFRRVRRG